MAMNVEQILHMVGGDGETSYASNSRLQEKAILGTKSIVEESIRAAYDTTLPAEDLVVADLGCSSGPNTFLFISHILEAVGNHCRLLGRSPPDVQCFLNDLPGNDFNTLFRCSMLSEKQLKEWQVPYCVVGAVGSFYRRLFPRKSVHFFHSSFALGWLSQVPLGLESNSRIPLNERSIYISKTSPPTVVASYSEQFKSDFATFLRLRHKELVLGGKIVLTIVGRKSSDATNGEVGCMWGLLADALNAMVLQGLLQEEDVNTFNLPFYAPSIEEVRETISNEASFYLNQLQTFELNWDPFDDSEDTNFDNLRSGENVANYIRAGTELILKEHFGNEIMDELFSRFSKNVSNHLLSEKTKYLVIVVVLAK